MRAYMLTLLDVIPDGGERTILFSYSHPEEGWEPTPRTVAEMIRGYTEHIYEHIAEIAQIRASHGV
jgi:hypothetical protein